MADLKRLNHLLDRAEEIRAELSRVSQAADEEFLRLVKEIHGVQVGDIVIHKNCRHKVSRVEVRLWRFGGEMKEIKRPWLEGFPEKVNGGWSKSYRNLNDCWKTIEEHEAPSP